MTPIEHAEQALAEVLPGWREFYKGPGKTPGRTNGKFMIRIYPLRKGWYVFVKMGAADSAGESVVVSQMYGEEGSDPRHTIRLAISGAREHLSAALEMLP